MIKRLGVVALVALALACGAPAEPKAPKAPNQPVAKPASKADQLSAADVAKQLDPYIASLGKGEANQFSGFVFVAQGDRVVYERGWGYANYATKQRADRNTSFRIGSVTKQFTAVAILQLQDKGLLSVQDKIAKHLPKYPALAADITIHHLLTHTSGIPNYTNDEDLMKRGDTEIAVADLVAAFSAKKLDFVPGTKFSYSNSGYAVLGAIVEAVSKQSYHDYVRDHVFGPAGLKRTLYGDAKGADNRALGYKVASGKLTAADKVAMSMAFAAGGVRSTAGDLWRWHRAIETNKILSAAARKQMYTAFKNHYAYGWVVRDRDGKRMIGHDGGIPGFGTSYLRLMANDVTIVCWTNNPRQSAGGVARAAAKVAMGEKVEPLKNTVSAELAKRVAGAYVMDEESQKRLIGVAGQKVADSVAVIDIKRASGGLTSQPLGQPPLPLSHKSALVFQLARVGATLTFSSKPASAAANAAKGAVTNMTLEQGGMKFHFVRDDAKAAAIKASRKP